MGSDPPAGAPCIFCEIIARRAPSHIVYEDPQAIAFLDLFPFTRGHLLVVPKRHVDRLIDLPPEDYHDFLSALANVCRQVERVSHHYNVAMNQGELAGQIVFHLHVHVIPRYGKDNPFAVHPRARLDETDARSVVAAFTAP